MSTRTYSTKSGKTILLPACQADLADGNYCRRALGHDGDHDPNPPMKCPNCEGSPVYSFRPGVKCPRCGGSGVTRE